MTNDRHQKNKKFLGDLHDFPEGSMAVGRLDETSEGLLLITTDGQLSSHINKKGKVRRSRIFYLRNLTGKSARIKEKK